MGVERITEFLAVVSKAKKQCLADLTIHEVDYLRGYYEISSLKRTLTRYRNAVKTSSLSVDHQTIVLKNLCLSPVESDTFRIEGKKINTDLGFEKIWFLRMKCPTGRIFIEGVPPDEAEKNPKADAMLH